ncbi:MAG: hypothetical protein RIQ81_2685 [Pseudomonadota bacterium]|jgi:polar amino acid transport system substrate-binding protein
MPPQATAKQLDDNKHGIVEVNDNDWPPFFFGGQKDKPPGFAKELVQHCLDRQKVRYLFRNAGIKRSHKELEEGLLDLNVYSHDERRDKFLVFGKEPLFRAAYKPFVRADSKIRINQLSDFDSLKIGHLAGLVYSTEYANYLARKEKSGQVATVNDPGLNLKMLVEGKIDTFVNTTPTVWWKVKELGYEGKIKSLDFKIKEKPYFISVSKASKRIRDPESFVRSMDRCIREVKTTSFYRQLTRQYGDVEP